MHRHDVRTDLAASFEYDATWLASENKFMLDPRLDLYAGEQHVLPPKAAFGVLMDSAPDRWGRVEGRAFIAEKGFAPDLLPSLSEAIIYAGLARVEALDHSVAPKHSDLRGQRSVDALQHTLGLHHHQ